jgi:hypothetical protein
MTIISQRDITDELMLAWSEQSRAFGKRHAGHQFQLMRQAGRTVPAHQRVETLTNTDLTTEEEFLKEQTMSLSSLRPFSRQCAA